MKKTFAVLGIAACIFSQTAKHSLAAFVEFHPKTAQFVSPSQKQNQNAKSAPKVLAASGLSEAYIKVLVSNAVKEMAAKGLLKGEKGDKGDAGEKYGNNFDPEYAGFQPTIIQGSIVGPDVGTVFAATQLSSDSLNSASINVGNLSSESLSVSGESAFEGSVTAAAATMQSIKVGTITSDSGAYLSEGGDWVNASSRELKENLATTSPRDILSKIDALPIYTWNYKNQTATTTHIGPMAEDFYSQFGFGNSSTSISTIDPSGVALAGVQGLSQKLNSLLDLSWLFEGLKQMGVEIQNGLVKLQKLAADFISTKDLEVGSKDQPSGITMYDRLDKNPFCVYVEGGQIKAQAGKCGEQDSTVQAEPQILQPEPNKPEADAGNQSADVNSQLPLENSAAESPAQNLQE